MADIFKLPVKLPDMNSENAAALGAAILAMTGTGAYESVPQACEKIIKLRNEVYNPNEENAAYYDKVYVEFDKLYPQLKDSFKSILEL